MLAKGGYKFGLGVTKKVNSMVVGFVTVIACGKSYLGWTSFGSMYLVLCWKIHQIVFENIQCNITRMDYDSGSYLLGYLILPWPWWVVIIVQILSFELRCYTVIVLENLWSNQYIKNKTKV